MELLGIDAVYYVLLLVAQGCHGKGRVSRYRHVSRMYYVGRGMYVYVYVYVYVYGGTYCDWVVSMSQCVRGCACTCTMMWKCRPCCCFLFLFGTDQQWNRDECLVAQIENPCEKCPHYRSGVCLSNRDRKALNFLFGSRLHHVAMTTTTPLSCGDPLGIKIQLETLVHWAADTYNTVSSIVMK